MRSRRRHRTQNTKAAVAQEDLMGEAVLMVATVEAVGDAAGELDVALDVGVEQVERDPPDVGPPDLDRHRLVADLHGGRGSRHRGESDGLGVDVAVVLDLAGAGTSPEDLTLEVTSSAGSVFHPVVQPNPAIGGLRANFEFDPGTAPMIEFRAVVREGAKPVSETWLYRWTAS